MTGGSPSNFTNKLQICSVVNFVVAFTWWALGWKLWVLVRRALHHREDVVKLLIYKYFIFPQADNNHAIELDIEHLKLPCSQWLKIRTGDSMLSHLTAHLTQSSNISYPLYSTGPLFFLEFFSDVPLSALQECNGGFLIHAKQIGMFTELHFSLQKRSRPPVTSFFHGVHSWEIGWIM